MLKILQARLQQYVNRERPDVQAGFRKGRGTRHQIANIRWIMEKAYIYEQTQESICYIVLTEETGWTPWTAAHQAPPS